MIVTKPSTIVNTFDQLFSKLQEDLLSSVKDLRDVATISGLLNSYIYCCGLKTGVILRDSKRNLIFNQNNIEKLLNPIEVSVSMTHLVDYLKEHWTGFTYTSKKLIERYRRQLSEFFKIFTLEERDWSVPANRHRAPNPCGSFDILQALMLARACEIELLTRYRLEEQQLDWSQEIGNGNYPMVRDESTSLPAHKGWVMMKLFGMVFKGITGWRKESEPSTEQPLSMVVTALRTKHLALQAEIRLDELVEADPEREPEEILATEVMEIVETEVVESEGVAALVEKVAATIPLLWAVRRREMRVSPKVRRSIPVAEASVNVPCWALKQSDCALAWWEKRIERSGLWLSQLAPSWVWDAVLPF